MENTFQQYFLIWQQLQNTTQKTKDRATRTPLKLGVNSYAPVGLTVPAPLATPVVGLPNDMNIIWYIQYKGGNIGTAVKLKNTVEMYFPFWNNYQGFKVISESHESLWRDSLYVRKMLPLLTANCCNLGILVRSPLCTSNVASCRDEERI
jgi:hypothetical protein